MYLQVLGLKKPKHFAIEILNCKKKEEEEKEKKKTCFWLFPSLWLSGVSVDICGCLGTLTGGIWPKGPETATRPPWRTAARKNGA